MTSVRLVNGKTVTFLSRFGNRPPILQGHTERTLVCTVQTATWQNIKVTLTPKHPIKAIVRTPYREKVNSIQPTPNWRMSDVKFCHADAGDTKHKRGSPNYLTVSPDRASCEVKLPGWSGSDMSLNILPLEEPLYLRIWRLPIIIDSTKELALRNDCCWMEIDEYEKTHFTYYKCMSLERCISVDELNALGSFPNEYGVTMTNSLGNIGGTSCQHDTEVSLTSSGKLLFRSSVVIVAVDIKSRSVTKHPEWWSKKYSTLAKQGPGFAKLRVNLPKSHPKQNFLHKSSRIVQPTETDYYGHVNNNFYGQFAFDGLLVAQKQKKIQLTQKELENSIKRIEADYISDCLSGDLLDVKVYGDSTNKWTFYVDVLKADNVIYSQSFEYEPQTVTAKI